MTKKQALIILFFALTASLLSLIYVNRIGSGGFFSLYQGPSFIDRGWPWTILRCHDIQRNPYGNEGCFIEYHLLVLNLFFWYICGLIILLIINIFAYIKRKFLQPRKKV